MNPIRPVGVKCSVAGNAENHDAAPWVRGRRQTAGPGFVCRDAAMLENHLPVGYDLVMQLVKQRGLEDASFRKAS